MIQCWIRSGDGPAGDGWFQQNQHLQPDRVPIPWLENDLPPCCTKPKLAPAEGAVEKPWQTLRKLRNEMFPSLLFGRRSYS